MDLNFSKNNMNLLNIILFGIISIILIIIVVVKLRFRFWADQPVFHLYDISYYLFYSGIINKSLPEKTRYTNFKDVETLTFGKNVKAMDQTRFIRFINKYYLRNGDNQFSPKESNIIPYFEGHNSACFLSFYKEALVLHDGKTGDIINTEKPIGVMTTRPVHIRLKKGTTSRFDAYYVDYLCVDPARRKKGIAPQIIATHHYNQRILNREIQVSIFKREGQLTGIVPLCVFGMPIFSMKNWSKPSDLLVPYSLIECGTSNIHHLYDFLRDSTQKFDISIMADPGNIMALMKSNNIFIYLLLEDKVGVVGAYFFKKSCTEIKKGEEAIICFASVSNNNSNKMQNIFIHGFKQVVSEICLKPRNGNLYYHLVVEDIGDNDCIIANLKQKTWPSSVVPAAYFFYNYAHPTIHKNKVLIIL